MPKEQLDYLLRFIKQLADLDLKERRKPQRGLFRIWQGKTVIEWEIRTAGSTASEQVTVRRVAKDSVPRLSEVGLAPDQADALKGIGKLKQGIFLVTGPSISGRTTTFYALLSEHDAYMNSIHTLEKEVSNKLRQRHASGLQPVGHGHGELCEEAGGDRTPGGGHRGRGRVS